MIRASLKFKMIALLLATALLFAQVPVGMAAEGMSITANTVTVTQGSTATVTVSAANLADVSALELDIYYDSSALTLSSVTAGSMISSLQPAINSGVPGHISLDMISLVPVSGNGTLLTLIFSTASNCEPGTYPITVSVGEVLDSSVNDLTVSGVDGAVTVNQKQATITTFYLYHTVSKSKLRQGDETQVTVRTNYYNFAAADILMEYDRNLFEVVSVELDKNFNKEGVYYSVNTDMLGRVHITCTSLQEISFYNMFTVKLRAVADVDATTTIKTTGREILRADGTEYKPYSVSSTLTMEKMPVVTELLKLYLENEKFVVGRQNAGQLKLEADSQVAVANFYIEYDPAVLRCVSVARADDLADDVLLEIDEDVTDGQIKLAYINMGDTKNNAQVLADIIWEPSASAASHGGIALSGKGVVGSDYSEATLDYAVDEACVFTAAVTGPTCTQEGFTTYTCACGDSHTDDIVAALGHSYMNDLLACDNCDHVRKLVGMAVKKLPVKAEYLLGEVGPTLAGGLLQLNFDDGAPATVDMQEAEAVGFNSSVAGKSIVTLTYEGISTSMELTILPADTPVIRVLGSAAAVGGKTSVSIFVENNPGITSAKLKVHFDSSVLTLEKVSDTGLLGANVHKPTLSEPYVLSWANDTQRENITKNGKIVTLTFAVAEGAVLGTYPVTVTYDNADADIVDADMNLVDFVVINGSVEVKNVILGDVNRDGSVNALDRIALARYLAEWDGYNSETIDLAASDVNQDGLVNALDRITLARHLAEWDGYEELPYLSSTGG